MAEFLDKARELFAANPHSSYHNDLECVFDAISKLQRVHSKSRLDIVNLESVFSAFEMAVLLDVEPSQPGLLTSMKRLITWTLDESMRFSLNSGRIVSSAPYRDFARLILKLSKKQQHRPTCTVITFNYDFAVDAALHGEGLNPDYGLTQNPSGAVNLFKLHGSVNWHRCTAPTCKKIVPTLVPHLDRFGNTAVMRLSELSELLGGAPVCCGSPVAADSVIVPPSWDKSEYRSDLVNVWRRAAIELQNATSIVVCGYSLPRADSFFPYLYGLGTVGEPLEKFWVFDPCDEVHSRFRDLLGPGAQDRFVAHSSKFESAIAHLDSNLPL